MNSCPLIHIIVQIPEGTSPQIFKKEEDPENPNTFAIRTDYKSPDGESKRYYILPLPLPRYNGQGIQIGEWNTLLAVDENTPENKYAFHFHESTYRPCLMRGVSGVSGVGGGDSEGSIAITVSHCNNSTTNININ